MNFHSRSELPRKDNNFTQCGFTNEGRIIYHQILKIMTFIDIWKHFHKEKKYWCSLWYKKKEDVPLRLHGENGNYDESLYHIPDFSPTEKYPKNVIEAKM